MGKPLWTSVCADAGKTTVVVLHDLNLACRYCDHVIMSDAVVGTPMIVPR